MSEYTSKKLNVNILFSIIQILISAFVLFCLYKFAINKVGIKEFGIWSVVSTSITSLSILNYGFSGSMVKYIATYQSKGDAHKVKRLIDTSVISIIIFSIILSSLGYLLFSIVIPFLIKAPASLLLAQSLIKICLVTFCITIVSNAFQSALEGLNYISTKSVINCIVSVMLLIFSFFFLEKFGLIGLGFAYLAANIIGLISSVVTLSIKFPAFSLLKCKWDGELFKETLKYNYNFQVISLFSLLSDPVTKLTLTKFGGTEYAGIYELASKLIMQIRNVLATANQALVPIFASLAVSYSEKREDYFKNSFFYMFIISTLLFFSVIAFAPMLSVWWLKGINYTFIFFLDLITVSWYINSVAMPAYFANLGSGDMKWNLRSHVGMGVANVLLSLVIGFFFKPVFISLGWFFSLSFFSVLIIVYYNKDNHIRLKEIMPTENWIYLAFNIGFSFILTLFFLNFYSYSIAVSIMVAVFYMAAQVYMLFRNAVGKNIKTQLIKYIGQ
jgi:O-antigen/teichoic acid export membrane protein